MSIKPTYANVASTVALLLVVGGGAYAATELPKHSVGKKQIQPNAVNAKKVKDGSLKAADMKPGQLLAAITGTPMGGDLTGTFPAPKLAASALADLVGDDELDAVLEEALEDFVVGRRVTGAADLPAASGHQSLLSIPGVLTVTASCVQAGPTRGLEVRVTNDTASSWTYGYRLTSQAPALATFETTTLSGGASETIVYPPDATNSALRYLDLTVLDGRPLEIEVTAITDNAAAGCTVRGSVFHELGTVS